MISGVTTGITSGQTKVPNFFNFVNCEIYCRSYPMAKQEQGLPEQISQQLLQRIINKELMPGSVLPSEREISESYAVSRSVAREAIKLLMARGIVEVHPRQGATIGLNLTGAAVEAMHLAFHQANVVQEDLLNARMLIEPQVTSLAASVAQPKDLHQVRQIRQLADQLIGALDQGDREQANKIWPQIDPVIHVVAARITQNPVLAIMIEVIDSILWPSKHKANVMMTEQNMRDATLQHAAICDALLDHDPKAAYEASMQHLEYTRDHIFGAQQQLHEPVKVFLNPSNE
jgi:DNA-binding FadR family transcriptional regulator